MKRFFFRFVWGVLLALNCFPWFFFYSHAQQEGGTSLDPSATPGPILEGNVDGGTVPMEREPKPRNSAQGSDPLPTTTAPLVNVYAQANLNMLPTSSPTESGGYGEPMNVLDIPRQIFPVNQAVLQTVGAGTLGYFDAASTAFLSPGSTAFAGELTQVTPLVRGMHALPYFNGMPMRQSRTRMVGCSRGITT